MGLELKHVLSDERHYGSFLCTICQNLCGLDALVTIGCSHVFCKVCLETWLSHPQERKNYQFFLTERRCPTCNRNLCCNLETKCETIMIAGQSVDVRPLSEMQPLAHRVLKQIRVSCPLAKHNCQWYGDYSDLQDHLLSSTAHDGTEQQQQQQQQTVDSLNNDNHSKFKRPKIDGNDHLQDHSLNESTTTTNNNNNNTSSQDIERKIALASSFKEEGNNKFSTGNYHEAKDLYTKALSVIDFDTGNISVVSNTTESTHPCISEDDEIVTKIKKLIAVLRANRAAALLKLREFKLCSDDCSISILLDPNNIKVYYRHSKALTELGNFSEAYESLKSGSEKNPSSLHLRKESHKAKRILDGIEFGMKKLEIGDYGSAKASFSALFRETSACSLYLGGARADLGLGLIESALRLSLQVIKVDEFCAEAYEIRGIAMFLMGDFDSGLSVLRQSLRLDPDSDGAKGSVRKYRKVNAKINAAKDTIFHRKFNEAIELITSALELSKPLPLKAPLFSMLYSRRAEANIRLQKFEDALRDCELAIRGRDDCVEAWLYKAKALHGLGRDEDAMNQLGQVLHKWGANSRELQNAYETAEFEVRKKKRPDYYKIFGVSKIASEIEIKKAYKEKAKEYHPDRYAGKSVELKRDAEEKFKLLGAGLEILCDDFKRQLYDEGYDDKAIRERVEVAKRAAHHPGNYCRR